MTAHDERSDRAEQLRAGFEEHGERGVTADEARQARQRRLAVRVVGALAVVAALVAAVFRLSEGVPPGAWTLCYAGGAAIAALGIVLARRPSHRPAFALIVVGVVVMSLGDSMTPR